MTWNRQNANWPHFSWDQARLVDPRKQFLLEPGALSGLVKHLSTEERETILGGFDEHGGPDNSGD